MGFSSSAGRSDSIGRSGKTGNSGRNMGSASISLIIMLVMSGLTRDFIYICIYIETRMDPSRCSG